MKVVDTINGKSVILSHAFDSRAKILNSGYFLCFAGPAIGLLVQNGLYNWFNLVSLVMLYIGIIFLNKACQAEKLIVQKNQITIVRSGFLNRKSFDYEVSKISKFRHLGKPEITKHPLAGESFDYLGFQTEQAVINELHGDNRIGFDYDSRTVTFGENIYSWDFEQLEIILYDITGNDFRYDDEFEKTFYSSS